MKKWRNISTIQ